MRKRSKDLLTYSYAPAAAGSMFSPNSVGLEILTCHGSATASVAWTANRLIFIPFITGAPVTIDRFWWYNGLTAAGNTDVGIYNFAGTSKLSSTGATANSGTSVLQQVDVTNSRLAANTSYWLALGCDDGTHTYFSHNFVAQLADFIGIKEQLSGWSSGLPTSITLGTPTVAVTPAFGFSVRLVA